MANYQLTIFVDKPETPRQPSRRGLIATLITAPLAAVAVSQAIATTSDSLAGEPEVFRAAVEKYDRLYAHAEAAFDAAYGNNKTGPQEVVDRWHEAQAKRDQAARHLARMPAATIAGVVAKAVRIIRDDELPANYLECQIGDESVCDEAMAHGVIHDLVTLARRSLV